MSEYPDTLPDKDDIRWCTGTTYDKDEPTSGRKDTGYAPNEIPASSEFNWFLNKYYEMLSHYLDRGPREFDTIQEALDATDGVAELDSFRVRQTVDNAASRGADTIFSNTQGQAGATAISVMCTDGQYIYYAQGANVYANDPEDGSAVWSHTTNTQTVNCLCCDGYRVYVGRATGAGAELEALDPADGTVEASATSATAITQLAANGVKLAAAIGNTVEIFSIGASTLTSDGAYTHGAAVSAVAIDDVSAYIGGARGTGNFDLRAISLATRAASWSVQLSTSAAPAVNWIATDGESVYSATDSVATPSGTASLFGNGPADGTAIWEGFGGINHDRVYVDDHYVFGLRDNGDTRIIHKADRHVVRFLGSGTMEQIWGVDPVAAVVTNGSWDFNRIAIGYGPRLCQKCDPNDIKRRPFFAQAVPAAGL